MEETKAHTHVPVFSEDSTNYQRAKMSEQNANIQTRVKCNRTHYKFALRREVSEIYKEKHRLQWTPEQ